MLKKYVVTAFFACTLISTNVWPSIETDPYLYEDWEFVEEKLLKESDKTSWLIKIAPWLAGAGTIAGSCYLLGLSWLEPHSVDTGKVSYKKSRITGRTRQIKEKKINKKKVFLSACAFFGAVFSVGVASLAKDFSRALYEKIQKPAYHAIRDYIINWLDYKSETPTILHPIFDEAYEKYKTASNPEEYIKQNYMRVLRKVIRLAGIMNITALNCRPALSPDRLYEW